MTFFYSVFLGIVQGITEFLPVSSSGHLALFQNLFGIESNTNLLFDIMLHIGTLVAVFVVFRKDILRMFVEILRIIMDIVSNIKIFLHNHKEKDAKRYHKIIHNNYRKFVVMILVSSIPTAIIGMAARELVGMASLTLLIPGVCLILNGGLLLVADAAEAGNKIPKDASYTSAFMVGIAQGVSTLPGLSRSGMTISACILCGYDKRFAVKYSFIMSIPAIIGAAILEIPEITGSSVTLLQFVSYAVGAAVAGLAGYVCIKKMLRIVRKRRFRGFSVYCFIMGIISIAGYLFLR